MPPLIIKKVIFEFCHSSYIYKLVYFCKKNAILFSFSFSYSSTMDAGISLYSIDYNIEYRWNICDYIKRWFLYIKIINSEIHTWIFSIILKSVVTTNIEVLKYLFHISRVVRFSKQTWKEMRSLFFGTQCTNQRASWLWEFSLMEKTELSIEFGNLDHDSCLHFQENKSRVLWDDKNKKLINWNEDRKKFKEPANTLIKETQKQSKYIIWLVQSIIRVLMVSGAFLIRKPDVTYILSLAFLACWKYIVPNPNCSIKMAVFPCIILGKSWRSENAKGVAFLNYWIYTFFTEPFTCFWVQITFKRIFLS